MKKFMTVEEAVKQFVQDGDSITIGGATTNRKPYAVIREVIKQGKKNLYLHGCVSGGDADMLIGAGCCTAYVNSYCANSGYSQVSRRYRRQIEEGKLLFEDYSLDVHAALYHAGAMGFPFIAVKHMLGSDLVNKVGISEEVRKQHPKLPPKKLMIGENPFNPGEKLCYIPVPEIDVAIVHVHMASPDGTARINGMVFEDLDMIMQAKKVILSCEEIVTDEEIRRHPTLNQIACILPDAIVHTPYGAHPSQMYGMYDYDRDYLRYYDAVGKEDALYDEYLKEWVYDLKDHDEYMEKLGIRRLLDLHVRKGKGYSVPDDKEEK
ncbi:glutaconate CoA-transferase [Clostridia bacterium OttesenSCG-928-F22]|nr:glutaconate CoA-transferase [Clostridia bacterium OttesenSCG-928-F22]